MEKKLPNKSDSGSNRLYFIFGLILIIILFELLYIINNFRVVNEKNYPLKRRNALTEKEIEEALKKMNNNLK